MGVSGGVFVLKSGVRIFIGPVFNSNVKYLGKLDEVIFISLTNKLEKNPKNVISSGVNALSQINAIKKLQKKLDLKRSVFLVPDNNYKNDKKNNGKHSERSNERNIEQNSEKLTFLIIFSPHP